MHVTPERHAPVQVQEFDHGLDTESELIVTIERKRVVHVAEPSSFT